MANEVNVSGILSFRTHFRAMQDVTRNSRTYLFIQLVFLGVPAIALIGALATGYDFSAKSRLPVPSWALLLAGPVFVLVFMPLTNLLSIWLARNGNSSIRGELQFIINHEGFQNFGADFNTKLGWGSIRRVVETKEFLLFYHAAAAAYFLPKAMIRTTDELRKSREIIRNAAGGKAFLREE